MVNQFRWLLFIPILILILGTYILLSNEEIIKKHFTVIKHQSTDVPLNKSVLHNDFLNRSPTYSQNLKNNRESAYPYFLLGSGLLLFILVLPKLAELSFSATNGFTLKVLQEVQNSIEEAKTATLAIEAKTKQSYKSTIMAEPSLDIDTTSFQNEIKKLEDSRKNLDTYSRILETRIKKKTK